MAHTEPAFPRYIAIEGPIGVGKTTLATQLAKRLKARLVCEEFTDNPFLAEFYRDRSRVAFQTKVYFLIARFKQQANLWQQDLFSKSIVSDYLFAKDRIFAYLNLSEPELQLYEKIYELIRPQLLKPDLVVYLQAKVDVLMHRLRKRGREIEATVETTYLEELMHGYNHFFFHYNESPLLVIETSDIDIVNNPQDFEDLVQTIRRVKGGTAHYIPQPHA